MTDKPPRTAAWRLIGDFSTKLLAMTDDVHFDDV